MATGRGSGGGSSQSYHLCWTVPEGLPRIDKLRGYRKVEDPRGRECGSWIAWMLVSLVMIRQTFAHRVWLTDESVRSADGCGNEPCLRLEQASLRDPERIDTMARSWD